ncbi:MAG: hypothetical protein ABIQ18_34235 [Umezawaea sp.]
MVKNLTDRVTRISDRMLGKVVPKAKADAACGAYVYCCGWNGVFWELGQWRRDVEHGGECTPCYALGVRC